MPISRKQAHAKVAHKKEQEVIFDDDDFVDPSDLLSPSLKALYDQKDRLFKEEQKRQKEFRKQEQAIKRQIQKEKEKATERRLQSAEEFQRRYKRDREHEQMNAMQKHFEADEKHFEPKGKKIIYNMKKVLDRRPKYSCDLIFFREIEDGDNEKPKSTIRRGDVRYRQIFSGFASVQGNILPFNNKRTYRTDSTEIWKQLKNILYTDPGIKRVINVLEESSKIDVIVIKNAVQIHDNIVNHYKPIKRKLFNSVSAQAICRNDISYEINKQAKRFGELFGIHLEQYTIDNFKANSCYLNLIVNTWHDSFNKRRPNGQRKFAELTYDVICNIIGISNKNQDIGISIKESKLFFKKYRLGLDVVNVYGQILDTYRPEKLNDHIFPQVLRMLVHNNHTYQLDASAKNKLDKLRARTRKQEISIDEISTLSVSNNYKLRKPVLDDCEIHYIDKLDDCISIIIGTEAKKIRFITNTNLLSTLFEMTHDKYTPDIGFASNKITSLGFKAGTVNARIENADNTAVEDQMIELSNKELYVAFHKADDEFYNKIIQERLKSEYPESVRKIDTEYQMGPTSGYFTKKMNIESETQAKDEFNAIDTAKAYTHCLRLINMVPVFGYFDRYETYDNHDIEDLTLYCVEVNATNFATTLLFPCDHTRCFGYLLKFAKTLNIDFIIKYFRRPCRIEHVNYQEPVDVLYNNEKLSVRHKKHIANKTTGLIEKWQNKAHLCKVFSTFAEAQFYQIKYGGRIFSLEESHMDQFQEDINDNKLSDEEYFKKYQNVELSGPQDCVTLHILVIDKTENLVDGYRSIKELIYNNMSIFMFNLYNKVIAAGIKPKGIKTDAILVFESKEELEKHFTFNPDEIGGLKFETGKTCNDTPVVQRSNYVFDIPQVQINKLEMKNEYDINDFTTIFDNHNRVLIKGLYPGVGKSYAVINYKGNHKILFVTPFNKLAQQTRIKGCDAITMNMLLGYYGDGKDYIKTVQYDVSQYDCICFDEILINPPHILQKIDTFMNKNTNKKFFATGDVDQLQPIDFKANNVTNVSQYLLKCINYMFPNQITLKINKRLKTDEQRNKLYRLKEDIFDLSKDPLQTLKSYGFKTIHKFSQIQTTQNICYFNPRTIRVNNHVHKNLVEVPKNTVTIAGTKYWPGLEIICKEHYKKDGIRMFVNYTYQIIDINKKSFAIKDIIEDKILTFPISVFSHFQLAYANTCHSVQGLSLDGPITIFDVNIPHVDRYYIWTAITRATDLDLITIFQHSKLEIASLKQSKIKQYFELKVKNYKNQDNNCYRTYKDKEYITADWISNMYESLTVESCVVCHQPYQTYIENGKVKSNLTVDRINSSLAHTTDNSRLCCITCNVTKANRY